MDTLTTATTALLTITVVVVADNASISMDFQRLLIAMAEAC